MKILIVGFGSIGKRHFNNLVELGYTDFIVLTSQDLTPLNANPISLKTEKELSAALGHGPDVAFICNPTSLHMAAAIEAAKAGCPVFLEKPISHNLDGIQELEALTWSATPDLFAAAKPKLQVGFQLRYHPVLQIIKKRIDEGEIGRVLAAHAHWGEWLPGWHPWEDYRESYSARTDLGGGAVLTLCHPFDYLHWMLGEAEVASAIGGKLSDLEMEAEDAVLVALKFRNGAIASVWLDYVSKPAKHRLEIIGTDGRIEWAADTGIAKIFFQNGNEETHFPGRHAERNELFLDEARDFMQCIVENSPPACTLADGIRALKTCLKVKELLATHDAMVRIGDSQFTAIPK